MKQMQKNHMNLLIIFGLLGLMVASLYEPTSSEVDDLNPNLIFSDNTTPQWAADRNLTISLDDRDTKPINNALVTISNGTHMFQEISDGNGNVSFIDLVTMVWNIRVNYFVGSQSLNFSIYNENYDYSTDIAYVEIVCNLTTINLSIGDNAISNREIWGLLNANLTMQDRSTGQNLTSFITNELGFVQLKLPATDYDFNLQYQGKSRTFFFYIIGGDNAFNAVQNLTVNTEKFYYVHTLISELNTQLNLINATYLQSEWFHQTQTVKPFSTSMYFEDGVNLTLQWKETKEGTGIQNPAFGIWNTWNLYRSGIIVNSSSIAPNAIQPISSELGNYSFFMDSFNYYTGTYVLSLTFSKPGCQDALTNITINFLNQTAQLKQLPSEVGIPIQWNTTLVLQVNYTSMQPYVQNVTGAQLFYRVSGYDFSGSLTAVGEGTGIYTLVDLMDLPVNVLPYSLEIYGNRTNFAFVTTTVFITVTPVRYQMEFVDII